jgi:hypothetical protein
MLPCYFCGTQLQPFIDVKNSGNYDGHYCCYACPQVESPAYNLDVWKNPYHVIVEDNGNVNVSYLYFHGLKLWLHIFDWDNRPFMDIKDEKNNCLFRINNRLNPFNYQPNQLENKLKTWIIFS